MRYVVPVLLLLMVSVGSAQERKEEQCDCRHCVRVEVDRKIKERAAEEARRRRERIHNRKFQPRIIINFRRPIADRNGRVINYNILINRWDTGYPRYRRLYRGIYDTRPSYRNYRDRTRRVVDEPRRVWYDGLRTRTDRPQPRRR